MRLLRPIKVLLARYGADIALYSLMIVLAGLFNYGLFVAFDKEQDNAQEQAMIHQLKHEQAVQEQGEYAYIAPADKAVIEMRQRE